MSEPPAEAGGLSETKQEPNSDWQAKIVGTLQITFTPSISFQGGKRATIESVRVDKDYRDRGIGKQLINWAIERAREEGGVAMQLTTSIDRKNAQRFYEKLGFKGSHLGMKLYF